ncbi:LysE family translocator [Parasulfitobacter algicola]|uniref:LysE family translocator n=1 Tax=Parasulfitobacter algicola TaxID=2614809 RepID=A0ABX2J0Z3_9RHOB|nr:LysE family translocator [Sulfitobacter algicola]NSX56468.1 LysE family translocator [Sulfitobacter algicola]
MIETTIALIIFLFPLAYSPGPGNMFFAANGARFGFRATIPANAGYHIATWIVTFAIGFGFLATLDKYPQIFMTLKIAGALYVFWLAWKLFRMGTLQENESARPANFIDGVMLLLLNPKAYVIIGLMFTQFLAQSQGSLFTLVLLITTVFTLNNLLAFSIWTIIGDSIANHFRSPETAGILNKVFGVILALVATWMLFF